MSVPLSVFIAFYWITDFVLVSLKAILHSCSYLNCSQMYWSKYSYRDIGVNKDFSYNKKLKLMAQTLKCLSVWKETLALTFVCWSLELKYFLTSQLFVLPCITNHWPIGINISACEVEKCSRKQGIIFISKSNITKYLIVFSIELSLLTSNISSMSQGTHIFHGQIYNKGTNFFQTLRDLEKIWIN